MASYDSAHKIENGWTALMRVEEIVASDAFERFGDAYLPIDVQVFVVELIQLAKLPKDSIPVEAVLSSAVQYYIGEVENGGHNGFIGNSQWDTELLNEIRAGVGVIGLHDVAQIFAELEAYEKSEPRSFHSSDWTDSVLQTLDDRMRPICSEAHQIHARWLQSVPNIRIVPDVEYPKVRRASIETFRAAAPNAS